MNANTRVSVSHLRASGHASAQEPPLPVDSVVGLRDLQKRAPRILVCFETLTPESVEHGEADSRGVKSEEAFPLVTPEVVAANIAKAEAAALKSYRSAIGQRVPRVAATFDGQDFLLDGLEDGRMEFEVLASESDPALGVVFRWESGEDGGRELVSTWPARLARVIPPHEAYHSSYGFSPVADEEHLKSFVDKYRSRLGIERFPEGVFGIPGPSQFLFASECEGGHVADAIEYLSRCGPFESSDSSMGSHTWLTGPDSNDYRLGSTTRLSYHLYDFSEDEKSAIFNALKQKNALVGC